MLDNLLLVLEIATLILVSGIGWILTLFGMPGNWVIVAGTACYAWLGPSEGAAQLSWGVVGVFAVLAVLGEIAETAAGMWGASRVGGSRRAAVFSLIGSILGALGGAALGVPVPLVGSAIAAVGGGALGALAGAALAEQTRGESSSHALRVGRAAFWGRLLGTGAKTVVSTALVIGVLVALIN